MFWKGSEFSVPGLKCMPFFILIALIFAAVPVQAAAVDILEAPDGFESRLDDIESALWDDEASNLELEKERRIERLEALLYGRIRSGDLQGRLEALSDYIYSNEGESSLSYLLSYLEGQEGNEQKRGQSNSPGERLASLEAGTDNDINSRLHLDREPIVPRLQELFSQNRQEENANRENNPSSANNPSDEDDEVGETIDLKSGTIFKARFEQSVNSDDVQTGRLIDFTISEDFIVDDHVVLPAGTEGRMRVRGSESAGRLGRDGRLDLEAHTLKSLDGKDISFDRYRQAPSGVVDTTIHFFYSNRSRFLAAGVGAAAAYILDHPGGLIFGAAVPGREEKVEKGEVVELVITENLSVAAIPLDADR